MIPSTASSLLTCLERLEKQAYEIANYQELIYFFCKEVIPFFTENSNLNNLRNNWKFHRDYLNQKVQETETQALLETKETFWEAKKAIGNSNNELVRQQLSYIENLIKGQEKLYGPPLYRTLYNELKQLFQLILKLGHKDLCRRYAKLASRQVYVQKDLKQSKRWICVPEGERASHFLSEGEIQETQEQSKNILFIPSDYELIKQDYIEEFTFAPAVIHAYSAMDAVHWKRYKDPAIVSWYFESALWCWRTPESYFDYLTTNQKVKDYDKYFHILCQKCTWREIASVRDNKSLETIPVIFTRYLFQNGLTTLINSINFFLSNSSGASFPISCQPIRAHINFELILDGNELWVKATFENQETELFYVQKFHEGSDPEGSALFKFIKNIFKKPVAGEKKAKLLYKWESASKHINRLKIPKKLKEALFGKAFGSTFNLKGIVVELPDDSTDVLRELREHHLKMPNKLENRR